MSEKETQEQKGAQKQFNFEIAAAKRDELHSRASQLQELSLHLFDAVYNTDPDLELAIRRLAYNDEVETSPETLSGLLEELRLAVDPHIYSDLSTVVRQLVDIHNEIFHLERAIIASGPEWLSTAQDRLLAYANWPAIIDRYTNSDLRSEESNDTIDIATLVAKRNRPPAYASKVIDNMLQLNQYFDKLQAQGLLHESPRAIELEHIDIVSIIKDWIDTTSAVQNTYLSQKRIDVLNHIFPSDELEKLEELAEALGQVQPMPLKHLPYCSHLLPEQLFRYAINLIKPTKISLPSNGRKDQTQSLLKIRIYLLGQQRSLTQSNG